MNDLQALYQLQTLETSLDNAKKRLAEIQAEIENSDTVREAKDAHQAREQDHHQANATAQDLELELASLAQKSYETEELLYSGKLTNPKELQDREKELDSLKRRHEKLSEDLDTAKEQRDITQNALADAADALKAAAEASEAQNADLIKEQGALQKDMRQWLVKRKKTLKQISSDHHKIYKALKTKKRGIAVARLQGRACSACQVEQTQMVVQQVQQTDQLVQCASCSRILVKV